MRKRILAILMAFALFVVMGPAEMFVFAVDGEGEDTTNVELQSVEPEAEAVNEEAAPAEGETPAEGEATVEEPAPAEGEATPAEDEATAEEPAAEEGEAAPAEELVTEDPALLDTAAVSAVTLSAAAITGNSVTLSWTITKDEGATVGPLTIFKGSEQVAQVADPVAVTTYQVTGLNQNTAYSFTAKIGEVTSDALAVTTAKVAIPGFRSVSSHNAVYLKWTPVAGAAKYVITTNALSSPVTLASGANAWKHAGISPLDIINLSNAGSGASFSGNIDGKDRFTYSIIAYDAAGNAIAEGATTGDIVKTLYYKLTFKSGATLTSHSGGKKKIKIKKGAVVYARGFTNGKYIFDYKCSDGKVRTFHTMKIRVKAGLSKHITAIKSKRGQNTQPAYTVEEAEQFVNDRGIKKATSNYMIWVNLFSQKEYIFQKSGGRWRIVTANEYGLKNKVMAALPVSTGKATMPTATGSTKINRKLTSQHGTPLWNVTKYFSIHGVQKKWPSPGWPESGACARNQKENATWIFKKIPKYTRVFVH